MNSVPLRKSYGDTDFITGMRAFAALAVVLIHSGGAGLRELGAIGNNIADLGRAGVYVFFVISGFSVASSYETSRDYFEYISKRLWRIAPLYYFWLAAAIAMGVTATYWQSQFNVGINLRNIFLHIFFLGFFDYRITNSIIGVEWSISVEVFWYFVVPFFVVVGGNGWRSLLLLLMSILVYVCSVRYSYVYPVVAENAELAMHWSPIPYALSYALGLAAYRFRQVCGHSNVVGNCIFILSALLFVVHVSKPGLTARIFYDDFVLVSVITTVAILFGTGKSLLFRLVFNNPVAQFLGVVSYGVYLCHLPLLGLISRIDVLAIKNPAFIFVILSVSAVLVSTLTYYLFERKFIALGENLRNAPVISRAA